MKALVISDRQEIIDFVTPLLKENGFDLIHYRWIIKALDNIEEIQPNVIVLRRLSQKPVPMVMLPEGSTVSCLKASVVFLTVIAR